MSETGFDPLEHVLWMGGSPCSGKTTIAHLLAERYGLRVYSCDDHLARHVAQASREGQPQLARIAMLSWDDLFLRPVPEMVCDEIAIYRQEFPMIVEDLAALPRTAPILAEGAALLPECVASLADGRRALWVVPSEPFLRRTYPQRGAWVQEILSQCSIPETAQAHWLARDAAFAYWAAAQARMRGMDVIAVDGTRSIDEVCALIEARWEPFLNRR